MHPSNISQRGEVVDLETVRCEFFGERVSTAMFVQDVENAVDSVRLWGAALDITPRLGLAKRAALTLREVLEPPRRGSP